MPEGGCAVTTFASRLSTPQCPSHSVHPGVDTADLAWKNGLGAEADGLP
jgi:hypothetical protein